MLARYIVRSPQTFYMLLLQRNICRNKASHRNFTHFDIIVIAFLWSHEIHKSTTHVEEWESTIIQFHYLMFCQFEAKFIHTHFFGFVQINDVTTVDYSCCMKTYRQGQGIRKQVHSMSKKCSILLARSANTWLSTSGIFWNMFSARPCTWLHVLWMLADISVTSHQRTCCFVM